jgi:hypothetical protein
MRQTVIHVLRQQAWGGSAVAFRIEVDGQEMGKLRNGENASVAVAPGPHALAIRAAMGGHSRTVMINLADGEEAEFTCIGTVKASLSTEYIELRQERWRGQSPVAAGQDRVSAGWVPEQVLEVVETRRSEEPIGDETRTIDNRYGNADVTRVIRASRDWSRSVTITDGRTNDRGGGISAGPQWVNVHAEVKSTLQRNYSISSDLRESHTEEITIQVPAGSCVQLVLHWKQIVQHGFVRVQEKSQGVVEVPFKVGISVTFDQAQRQVL